MVGSCLAVSGYEVLIGIDVYKIVGYFVQRAKSGLSPPLVQGWPGEGRGQGASRCLPAVIVGHESVLYPIPYLSTYRYMLQYTHYYTVAHITYF